MIQSEMPVFWKRESPCPDGPTWWAAWAFPVSINGDFSKGDHPRDSCTRVSSEDLLCALYLGTTCAAQPTSAQGSASRLWDWERI